MSVYALPRPGSTLTAPGKDLTFLAAPTGHLRFREDVGPDAPPVPLHVHLRQTERFTVIEGRLALNLDGHFRYLSPGESLEVLPGQMHSYAPADGASVVIEVDLWPHLQDQQFFETIYGFTREGRLPPRHPRDMLALLALCHRHAFYLKGPPGVLIRPLAAAAAALAAILRIDPWAPRFAARMTSMPMSSLLKLSQEAKPVS